MSRSAAPDAAVDGATACALDASTRSGVEIVLLDELAQFQDGATLLAGIWGADSESSVVSKDVLRALAHSGNYVAGAYLDSRLVGMSVGFLGLRDRHPHLHSHISGVAEPVQHRRIGFALKLHQRAWSLQRGLDRVVWTFDPLVRRNAYFNLAKLGASVTGFHPNFYGQMADGINAGDETDRAVVDWQLLSPSAMAAASGSGATTTTADPVGEVILRDRGDGHPERFESSGARLAAWVPADIVEVRRKDPQLAMAWRRALRATFGRAIESGYVATTMTRSGWYELERLEVAR